MGTPSCKLIFFGLKFLKTRIPVRVPPRPEVVRYDAENSNLAAIFSQMFELFQACPIYELSMWTFLNPI